MKVKGNRPCVQACSETPQKYMKVKVKFLRKSMTVNGKRTSFTSLRYCQNSLRKFLIKTERCEDNVKVEYLLFVGRIGRSSTTLTSTYVTNITRRASMIAVTNCATVPARSDSIRASKMSTKRTLHHTHHHIIHA